MLRKITSSPAFKAAMSKAAQNVKSAPAGSAASAGRRGLRGIPAAVAAALKRAQENAAEEKKTSGPSGITQAREAIKRSNLGRLASRLKGRKFKEGGMADKSGRAMKRKTADAKGRAMKKGK